MALLRKESQLEASYASSPPCWHSLSRANVHTLKCAHTYTLSTHTHILTHDRNTHPHTYKCAHNSRHLHIRTNSLSRENAHITTRASARTHTYRRTSTCAHTHLPTKAHTRTISYRSSPKSSTPNDFTRICIPSIRAQFSVTRSTTSRLTWLSQHHIYA